MPGLHQESTVPSKTCPPHHGHRPEPEPGRDDRGSPGLRLPLGVETAVGLWLIIATAVFGPSLSLAATGPAWNELACGVVVAIVAWIRLSAPRGAPWAGLVNVVLGAWLVAASLVIGRPGANHPAAARLNELLTGILITVIALVTVTLAQRRRSR